MAGIGAEQLNHLAETLWVERRLVEFLLFKLISAKLLLASDERRFVPAALSEIDQVLHGLRDAENARRTAIEEIAADTGIDEDKLSLEWLATRSPEPYRSVFADHRATFLQMSDEIDRVAAANRSLASAALSEVSRTIAAFNADTSTGGYDARGHERVGAHATRRLDETL